MSTAGRERFGERAGDRIAAGEQPRVSGSARCNRADRYGTPRDFVAMIETLRDPLARVSLDTRPPRRRCRHPESLALEWIGRERDLAARVLAIESTPVDANARDVEGC